MGAVSRRLTANDTVDGHVKAACGRNLPAVRAQPSLRWYTNTLFSAINALTVNRRNTKRVASVFIQHYNHFIYTTHKYRRHGIMVHRHNVVSARLKLGYRPVWQVSQVEDVSHYSTCILCHLPNANTLRHYCLVCTTVRDLLPQEQDLLSIWKYILQDGNLDLINGKCFSLFYCVCVCVCVSVSVSVCEKEEKRE